MSTNDTVTIKLDKRNKPVLCEFNGHQIPIQLIKLSIAKKSLRQPNELLSFHWKNGKMLMCRATPYISSTSKLDGVHVAQQMDGFRRVTIFFHKHKHGISKTKSIITIENKGNDRKTYGNFHGDVTVNILFEKVK